MRVLFVVKSKFMEYLGVMYLSSVIKAGGHECKIVSLDEAFLFTIKWEPVIVGYSIMTGDQLKFKELDRDIKHHFSLTKNVKPPKSIVGGPDPTFFPEGYGWADEIVRGEGEFWAAGLTEGTQRAYTIDDIPWPDRTDFPNMRIRDFITSRGCFFNSCTYCYNKRWMELFPEYKKVRVRSVDDVVAEIKHVNPEYVYFQDSVFGMDMNWMREFAEKYEKGYGVRKRYRSLSEKTPPYQCHLRPEMVNEERVELLKSSGCVAVRIALESASNRLRSLIGRHKTQLEQVRVASELLRKAGIQLMLQNILGLPSSSIEDDLFTLEMNIKYQPTYAWASIYQPYVGTDLGDYCKKEGYYKGNYDDIGDNFFDKSVLEFSEEHKEQLYCLQKIFALCVKFNYLPKPGELVIENIPRLVHLIMRKYGDGKLYLGLL
jgi:radical SAM superfamily enzyme YgiQ (UPF0313 family)